MRRLRQLEDENTRLKRVVADLTLVEPPAVQHLPAEGNGVLQVQRAGPARIQIEFPQGTTSKTPKRIIVSSTDGRITRAWMNDFQCLQNNLGLDVSELPNVLGIVSAAFAQGRAGFLRVETSSEEPTMPVVTWDELTNVREADGAERLEGLLDREALKKRIAATPVRDRHLASYVKILRALRRIETPLADLANILPAVMEDALSGNGRPARAFLQAYYAGICLIEPLHRETCLFMGTNIPKLPLQQIEELLNQLAVSPSAEVDPIHFKGELCLSLIDYLQVPRGEALEDLLDPDTLKNIVSK